jgi:L-lactate utilization protein LutC
MSKEKPDIAEFVKFARANLKRTDSGDLSEALDFIIEQLQRENAEAEAKLKKAEAAITYLKRQLSSAEYRAIWEEVEQITKEGRK